MLKAVGSLLPKIKLKPASYVLPRTPLAPDLSFTISRLCSGRSRGFTTSNEFAPKNAPVTPTSVPAVPESPKSSEDPFEILAAIPSVAEAMRSTRVLGPPTSLDFPFQVSDRREILDMICNRIIMLNYNSYKHGLFKDKKKWITFFLYGQSGAGKTRLALQLLDVLRDNMHLSPEFEHLRSEFSALLQESFTVLINIRHNGSAIANAELMWPAEVILGLRFAAEYWCPNIDYRKIREFACKWSPQQLSLFSLTRVAEFFAKHPPFGCSKPPKMIHLVIDEIQTAFGHTVPRHKTKESLARAFNRALLSGASSNIPVFMIGSLVGTALRSNLTSLEPTDGSSEYVVVRPLSVEGTRNIVRSFKNGDEWVALSNFDILLGACGGNPRTLEPLQILLDEYAKPPATLPLQSLLDALVSSVATVFNTAGWYKIEMGLFLALAGLPITRDTVVNPTAVEKQTVAALEESGRVTVRESSECRIMEIPLVVALAALNIKSETGTVHFTDVSAATVQMARQLFAPCYVDSATFEHFTILHRCFRLNVAVDFALLNGRSVVKAEDLYSGMICSHLVPKSMEFKAEHIFLHEPPVAGVWLEASTLTTNGAPVPLKFNLQDGNIVDLFGPEPHAIYLGGTNIVDGVSTGTLMAGKELKLVRIYDAKLTAQSLSGTLDYNQDIAPLIEKRRYLEQKLGVPVILEILSNRTLPPSTRARIRNDTESKICILSRDDLSFGVSPTFSPFLFTGVSIRKKG